MQTSLLINTFANPNLVEKLPLKHWEILVRQLKASNLTASFFELLKDKQLTDNIPKEVLWRFIATNNLSSRHLNSVWFEIEEIEKRLSTRGFPVILLKGGAYVAQKLLAHKGRIFADLDIMVPQHALNEIEKVLEKNGWRPTHLNEYDQRYYREWSHELPPMEHSLRKTVLDIHYTIIPPTATPKPNEKQLLADAIPVEGYEEIYTLQPVDMVIHSATHLFYDGELDHGIRDLVDLHNLLKEFTSQDANFWTELIERAEEMELSIPVFYALNYLKKMLDHPIPEDILLRSRKLAGVSKIKQKMMDIFFFRAFQPDHSTCSDWLTGFARWFLYIRSHYIKMPLRMLLPHLLYKATIARYKERKEQEKLQKARDFFVQFK